MLQWSIEAAQDSGVFDRIVVSTDDSEITELALSLGAEVPFLRPAPLSDDHATTVDVIVHALDMLERGGKTATTVDALCCLYATAPFVTAQDLRKAHDMLPDQGFVVPVTSFAFPIQRAVRITSAGRLGMFQPEHYKTRSQDLEEAYHDVGQFYWGRPAAWRSGGSPFGEATVPMILPRYRVQDIDTPEDWKRAEALFLALRAA